jgi:hypothetical protein
MNSLCSNGYNQEINTLAACAAASRRVDADAVNVSSWHLADLETALENVRFRG